MAQVFVSAIVEAPAESVWNAIRRFDAAADWLPFVASSPIEDGRDPTSVGCVRSVTQSDGLVFRETLVGHSDAERYYAYTFVGSPIPVRDHRTTIRLLPVTDGDRTYAEWSSRFDIAADGEDELVELMHRNFLDGLRALAQLFR